MEGVVEAAIIGVPDEIFGQAIKAFIVPNKEDGLTVKHILRFCQQNLEPFMVPKYVDLCSSLPKLSSGKIDKKQLK
jgi:acyl-coenzyme A synthetase/AMP-(fatty) acid ligase